MQSLYLTLPGIVPGEIYAVPMIGNSLPQRLQLNSEPWDVISVDIQKDPVTISKLFNPKKIKPSKKLVGLSGDKIVLGKGQKVIVPAVPASGKTSLLRELGNLITKEKSASVTNLLIDERPEEKLSGSNVRNINLSYMRSPKDILLGTLDTIAGVIKRVHNQKTDEVIFIDSLTRLVDVANNIILEEAPTLPSGTGGVSLYSRKFVRQILGLGNNIRGGGSLTIIGTCLIGGSTLEDTIYKDLKGVSNSELFIIRLNDGTPGVDPRKSYVRDQRFIK